MAESTAIEQVNLSQELSANATSVYCSVQGGDRKTKALIYNASNNPEHKVADFINKTIKVKDILVEMIEVAKTDGKDEEVLDENGNPIMEVVPRIVLIDENDKAYQAVSVGMFSAIKRLIKIFGAPTWDDPLPILIKQVSVKNGSMLTCDVVID